MIQSINIEKSTISGMFKIIEYLNQLYKKYHEYLSFGLSLDEELCLKAEFEANKLLSSSKIRNNFPSHTTRFDPNKLNEIFVKDS